MRLFSEDALAATTIYLEARGESAEGRVAIGRVIRNRMTERFFSDGTVAGTVLRPWQFSAWNSDTPGRAAAVNLDDEDPLITACLDAWRLSALDDAGIKDALLYYAPKGVNRVPNWADENLFVIAIGRHRFYRAAP